MKHIVGFSGGIDSQAAALWVLNRFPREDVILLNSDAGVYGGGDVGNLGVEEPPGGKRIDGGAQQEVAFVEAVGTSRRRGTAAGSNGHE